MTKCIYYMYFAGQTEWCCSVNFLPIPTLKSVMPCRFASSASCNVSLLASFKSVGTRGTPSK